MLGGVCGMSGRFDKSRWCELPKGFSGSDLPSDSDEWGSPLDCVTEDSDVGEMGTTTRCSVVLVLV